MKIKIFDPGQPVYHKIIIMGVLCTIVFSLVFLFIEIFVKKNIVIFRDQSRPNLIFVGKSNIDSARFEIGAEGLIFPAILARDIRRVDTNRSEIFDVHTDVRSEKFLLSTKAFNLDSAKNRSKNPPNIGYSLFIDFSLKLQNVGGRSAQIVFKACTDTLTYKPILRDELLNYDREHNNFILSYDNRLSTDLLHDSVETSSFHRFYPQFFDENNNFIVHFLILYKDKDENYYDVYYWAKYRLLFTDFLVIPEPLYREDELGRYVLYMVVMHYEPRKPTLKDFVFIEDKKEFEKKYNEEESKRLGEFLNKFK